jgi:hypothetical protein
VVRDQADHHGIVYNTKAAMKPASWTDLVKPGEEPTGHAEPR